MNDEIINKIKRNLLAIDWDDIDEMSIDESYDLLINNTTKALDLCTPEKTKIVDKRNTPLNLIKTKQNKLFRKCKGQGKNSVAFKNYLNYRNQFNKTIKAAKYCYYNNELNKF